MNVFWQGFFGSLAVAAFTGLTVVAYRHPEAYRRIYKPLTTAIWAVWAAWVVYEFGYSVGFGRAVLETMHANSGEIIKTPMDNSASWWYFLIPAAVYSYTSFLRLLPQLLRPEDTPKG